MRDTFDLDRGEEMAFRGVAVPGIEIDKYFNPSTNLLPGQPVTMVLPFTVTGYVSVGKIGIADTIPSTIGNVSIETDLSGGTILTQNGNAPALAWSVTGLLDPDVENNIFVRGFINPQISADTTINNSATMSGAVGSNLMSRSAQASASVVVPRLQFAPSAIEVEEDADPIEVTVTMDKINPFAPTNYLVTTQDATARAGKDFVGLTNHQVTIPAGAQSAKFTIELINDNTAENDEFFNVVLTSATGAALGVAKSATISIENEDDGPVVYDLDTFLPGIKR
jgi:hypothetical protein